MQALNRDWEKLSTKACNNHLEVIQGVDQVIAHLELLKDLLHRDGFQVMHDGLDPILTQSKTITKSALQAHKEYHSLYSRWQKTIDKKFNQTVLPLLGTHLASVGDEPSKLKQPFNSENARQALKRVITSHLLRQGRFDTASTFSQEAGCLLSLDELKSCQELYRITNLIRKGDLNAALTWSERNRDWLDSRESPLEFDLRRSEFIRILTEPDLKEDTNDHVPIENTEMEVEDEREGEKDLMESITFDLPDDKDKFLSASKNLVHSSISSQQEINSLTSLPHARAGQKALEYGRRHFPRFFPKRWEESVKLTSSVLFTPLSKLKRSPYAEFFQPATLDGGNESWVHAHHLVPLFIKEYCAKVEWSKELPLKVATDLGSGGALAKIAKVRSVMKEKRTEWSQADELPVEIPLPPEYRFHSVFACPVSKEQSTETNPPMMMPCGHVIAKESMQKLAKGGGTVKCPYCPSSASMNSAIQVYF